jgi:hypothetical protein
MREKQTNTPTIRLVYLLCMVAPTCFGMVSVLCLVTRRNTPIHNILSTAPQLSTFKTALGTLPEDGNVMPKHVGATIYNQ